MEKRSKEKIIPIELYTDGSCKKIGNITFGGWAFIAIDDGHEICSVAGHEYDTTNQRMELLAIIKGIEYVKDIREPNQRVFIYSDSAYVINCYLQQWWMNWQANGWVNSQKKDVANKDLWLQLIPYFDNFWYDFRKVKGHDNVYWNEECDRRAQFESEKVKREWRGSEHDT